MRALFLAHPVRGDVKGNLASAKRWVRYIEERYPNVVVVANWIYGCEVWDDSDEGQREEGIMRNLEVIERCDGIIAVGAVLTKGMMQEIYHARINDKPVYRLINEDGNLEVYFV